MPLYEYQCEACGRRFEVIQKMSDPPAQKCTTCGGPVHKLQSAPAFQFKGTGWYVTDYARKNQPAPDKADADSKGDKAEGGKEPKKDAGKEAKDAGTGAKAADSTKSGGDSASSTKPASSKTEGA